MNARLGWAAAALAGVGMVFGAGVSQASAQIGVYIGQAPPPLRYEARPPIPGPGYVWNDGYWNWDGGRYVWVGGRWAQPPYAGAYWEHPHYDHYDRGWEYHPGHWDHDDHGYRHNWDHDRR